MGALALELKELTLSRLLQTCGQSKTISIDLSLQELPKGSKALTFAFLTYLAWPEREPSAKSFCFPVFVESRLVTCPSV